MPWAWSLTSLETARSASSGARFSGGWAQVREPSSLRRRGVGRSSLSQRSLHLPGRRRYPLRLWAGDAYARSCAASARALGTWVRSAATTACHLRLGGAGTEREAQRRVRLRGREPHRQQHVRRRERARGAGRSGGDADALQIQRDEQRLAIGSVEVEVAGVRHPRRRRRRSPSRPAMLASTSRSNASRSAPMRVPHLPPAPPRPAPAPARAPPRRARSASLRGGRASWWPGRRAPARPRPCAPPARPRPAGPPNLCAGERRAGPRPPRAAQRHLARRLHRVRVEEDSALPAGARHLRRPAAPRRSRCWPTSASTAPCPA